MARLAPAPPPELGAGAEVRLCGEHGESETRRPGSCLERPRSQGPGVQIAAGRQLGSPPSSTIDFP